MEHDEQEMVNGGTVVNGSALICLAMCKKVLRMDFFSVSLNV